MRFSAARAWLLFVLPVLLAFGSLSAFSERALGEDVRSVEAETSLDDDDFFEVEPEEPEGYRLQNYRAKVPKTLKGATVLSNEEAARLWASKSATFIDVLPRAPKPPSLPKSTIWRAKKRSNIPGSVWLVNVGYGVISAATGTYFKSNLEKLTAGKKDARIVFYCLASCWMSWNAAKRAMSWGYSNVFWYPEGTDGWVKGGGKVELSEPVK